MEEHNKKLEYAVVSVDIIVVDDSGRILFTRRAKKKELGKWAFVGTFVVPQFDNLEQVAVAQVKKETGLDVKLTHLVDAFDDLWLEHPQAPGKVRVIQVVYRAEVTGGELVPTDHCDKYIWARRKPLSRTLAFNHKKMLSCYLRKLRKGTLIPVQRSVFGDYVGKEFDYVLQEYVYFVPKALILNRNKEILLGRRAQEPFKGAWDLPGGRMKRTESIKECLARELEEELGVQPEIRELFHIYSDKGKSPKYPGVMALYFAEINSSIFKKNVEMDEFAYFSLNKLPAELAFHIGIPLFDLALSLRKLT